eukprot:119998_1
MLFSAVSLSIISCVFSTQEYIYVDDQDLTQYDAEKYCASTYSLYDGHLASIHSESQNDEVAAACVNKPGKTPKSNGCTIGLENPGTLHPGTMWTDGTTITYTNWAPSQPKFETSTHPTVVIKPAGVPNGAGWWRVVKDTDFPFICEKDIDIETCGEWYTIVADRLLPGETLQTGEALLSASREWAAVLQSDGDFEVYEVSAGSGCFSNFDAGVYGTDDERHLVFQDDGNVVIYSDGDAVWSSDALNDSPGMLIMQDDGNLVAYTTSSVAYWATWFWGPEKTFQAFVDYFYEPTAQASLSLVAPLIGVFTCILLFCIYVIKHRLNKEYEPLLDQK